MKLLKKGEMHWYLIALIIAVVFLFLLVIFSVFFFGSDGKIANALGAIFEIGRQQAP